MWRKAACGTADRRANGQRLTAGRRRTNQCGQADDAGQLADGRLADGRLADGLIATGQLADEQTGADRQRRAEKRCFLRHNRAGSRLFANFKTTKTESGNLILVFMAECTYPHPDSGDIGAAIIALETQALEQWNNGNPDGFMRCRPTRSSTSIRPSKTNSRVKKRWRRITAKYAEKSKSTITG